MPTVVTLTITVSDRTQWETLKAKIDAFLVANPTVKLAGRVYVEEG